MKSGTVWEIKETSRFRIVGMAVDILTMQTRQSTYAAESRQLERSLGSGTFPVVLTGTRNVSQHCVNIARLPPLV